MLVRHYINSSVPCKIRCSCDKFEDLSKAVGENRQSSTTADVFKNVIRMYSQIYI